MPEYEFAGSVNAPPDVVFTFVSDVRNLPRYLPTTHAAEPRGNERVRVRGEAEGRQYDSDGYFRADPSARRLEWGADEGHYSGWLAILGDAGRSQVTVHLSFKDTDLPQQIEERASEPRPIQKGLEAGLLSIRNLVEGRGGKVEPPAAT